MTRIFTIIFMICMLVVPATANGQSAVSLHITKLTTINHTNSPELQEELKFARKNCQEARDVLDSFHEPEDGRDQITGQVHVLLELGFPHYCLSAATVVETGEEVVIMFTPESDMIITTDPDNPIITWRDMRREGFSGRLFFCLPMTNRLGYAIID